MPARRRRRALWERVLAIFILAFGSSLGLGILAIDAAQQRGEQQQHVQPAVHQRVMVSPSSIDIEEVRVHPRLGGKKGGTDRPFPTMDDPQTHISFPPLKSHD